MGVKNKNKMEKIRRPVVYKKSPAAAMAGLYLGPFVYFLSFVKKKKDKKSRQKRNADDAAHWRKNQQTNGGAPERFLSRQLDS